MRTPVFSKRFRKELDKCRKRGLNLAEIQAVMLVLMNDEPLEVKHHDHPLAGEFVGCRECHIRPDWLLVYLLNDEDNSISFLRTGTHADLFE
jgi:mRNA interferase YafQ